MNIPGTIVTVGLFIPYTGFTMDITSRLGPDDANSLAEGLAVLNGIAGLTSMQVIISHQKTTEL